MNGEDGFVNVKDHYNIQGWLTVRSAKLGNGNIFSMGLAYGSDSVIPLSRARYSGDISEWRWKQGRKERKSYSFYYDGLGRIVDSGFHIGESLESSSAFSEKNFVYDRNGNVKSMIRTGESGDSLASDMFTYDGNLRTDSVYDVNGNVVRVNSSDILLSYNILNLPSQVKKKDGSVMEYFYLADGTKSRIVGNSGNVMRYAGTFVYGSDDVLLEVPFGEGRIYMGTTGKMDDVRYFVKDHLGSVRTVVNSSMDIIESNDYYPFGTRHPDHTLSLLPDNRYRFSGKEEQDMLTTLMSIDFGARYYARLRWMSVDPLSEMHPEISPYAYCYDNPIRNVDPDGMDWYRTQEAVYNREGKEVGHKYVYHYVLSEEQFVKQGKAGDYLGEAVVIIKGNYDEHLGHNGRMDDEDASSASVMIYGINGPEDIKYYENKALTVSSDPTKYSMIESGEYRMFQQQMATSVYKNNAMTYRISAPDGSLELNPVGGVNKMTGEKTMTGVFLHRTDWNGNAGKASKGCIIIDARVWRDVEEQLGKSQNIYLKITR